MLFDNLIILYTFLSVFTVTSLSSWRLKSRKRLSEPPSLEAKVAIPFVGHLPGLITRRMAYFNDLGKKWRKPVRSVSILGTNIYLVGSAKILSTIERQHKVLNSKYFIAQFVPRMVGATSKSLEQFSANLESDAEGASMLQEGVKVTKKIMGSQTGNEMSQIAAQNIKEQLDRESASDSEVPIDLWEWVKHLITLSTSATVYGPDSPYQDPKVETAFWKFVDDSLWLSLLSFLPNWILSKLFKGYEGRETFVKAMNNYLVKGQHNQGSPLVNAHYPLFAAQLEHSEVARFETANGLGTLANTAPSAFWTVYHTFSDVTLLAEVRHQVDSITTTELSEDGSKTIRKINLKRLREAPILTSAVQEASRHRATGIGVRMVMQDTLIFTEGTQHVLKKGSVLVIANQAVHTDKTVWGDNASDFVASRFCGKTPQHAFRGFGNGSSACCGKNFAIFQVASFLAMMVARYDLVPEDGVWVEPGQDGRNSAAQVSPPQKAPRVRMMPRDRDMKGVEWEFSW